MKKDLFIKTTKSFRRIRNPKRFCQWQELALGYRETKDPSAYVLFKLKDKDEHFLVWTTTPWTLISNVALAVGSDVDYVKVLHKEKKIILAKELLENIKLWRKESKIRSKETDLSRDR